ncbi:MAG: XrtA/PEP-CTERM system TPR-repeat protein PrsT [Desulfuromonadales bacterium]
MGLLGCSGPSKDDLMNDALAQRNASNHRGAIVLLKSALEKDPNDSGIRFLLADSYLRMGKFDIAEKEFTKVSLQNGSFPELPLKMAQLYNLTGRPELARNELSKYRESRPESVEASQLLGEAYVQLEDYAAAAASFRTAMRLAPNNGELVVNLADCLMRDQKNAEAHLLLNQLILENPDNAKAHFYLGQLEIAGKNPQAALQHYQRVTELEPDNHQAIYTTGLLLLEKGEIDAAESLARGLLRKFPEQAGGYRLQGVIHTVRGNYAEAANSLQKVSEGKPDLLTSYMLGMSFYKLGQLEMAVNQFQRFLDHRPQAVQPRLILSAILLQQDRIDDAIDGLRLVLRHDRKNAVAHSTLGSAYLRKGLLDQAMAAFDKAIELDPQLLEAHYKKGLFSQSRGDLAAAEENILAAIALAPELPDLRLLLARNYLQREKFSQAISTLEEGLTGKQSDALLYNYLAAAYFAEKKNEQAVASLQKAKELKPDYLTPYYNLASWYALQRDYARSQQEYQAILARHPSDIKAMLYLAVTAELAGRNDATETYYRQAGQSGNPLGTLAWANYLQRVGKASDAIAVLDELMAKDAKSPAACELKGKILLAAGRYADAIASFTLLDRIAPGKGSTWLAQTYLRSGQLEEAAEVARNLVEKSPQDPAGYLALAAVDEKLGERERAIRMLRDAVSRIDNDSLLRMRLAELLERDGSFSAALEIYQDMVRRDEDFYPAIFAIGAVNERLGNQKRAVDYYQRVLRGDPDFVPALNNLAYHYAELAEHRREALDMALRAYRSQPENPWILDTLGYVFLRNERFDDARRMLEKAAALLPDVPTVHYHLALAYERLGKNDDSVRALRRAIDHGPFAESALAGTMLEKLSGKEAAGKL